MYCLISIQGKYAAHYRFKNQSAQSFKDLIQGITGKCCTVISSRFRTDIIYSTEDLNPKDVLKLWASKIDESLDRKQRHQFVFKSGKAEVLNHFFNSLNKLCHIHDWYREYVVEFNDLYAFDRNNPILKMIAECDNFLVSHDQNCDRPPLIEKRKIEHVINDAKMVDLLRGVLESSERCN